MININITNLCLSYGHNKVLNDICFRLGPGEMVGLIGPNGSGKSTIIRSLSRIIRPQSGHILLNDRDISLLSRQELACLLGVVSQMPLLPSAFTGFEIVLMGRNPHLGLLRNESPRDINIAWEAMHKTNTQYLAARMVSEISGGEIQCLLIARVLTQETKAILLDEPTANLDIGRQVEILDLMKRLCRDNGLVILAALHDLNLAAQYCSRLILLNNGHIHADGTPREVITPENIKDVYGVEQCVYAHPANGIPAVLLKSDNSKSPV